MSSSREQFDIIVIGGGVSGLGLLLEAAKQGYKALLIERDQIGAATSSQGLRIIHGGFKYLQQLNFPKVASLLATQNELVQRYPEFITPIKFIAPLAKSDLPSKIPFLAGIKIYSQLKLKNNCQALPDPRVIGASQVKLGIHRFFDAKDYLSWSDAIIKNPQAFHAALCREALAEGADIIEECEAISIRYEGSCLAVKVQIDGMKGELLGKYVVNTCGPWVRKLDISQLGWERGAGTPVWFKAFNLVTDRLLDPEIGISFQDSKKRWHFVVPRQNEKTSEVTSVFGTFSIPVASSSNPQGVSDNEMAKAIQNTNTVMKGLRLRREQISAIDLGNVPGKEATRGLRLEDRTRIGVFKNYIEIQTCRYTEFLNQAREIIDLVQDTTYNSQAMSM